MIFANIAECNSHFIFVTIGRFDITCNDKKKKKDEKTNFIYSKLCNQILKGDIKKINIL